MILRRESSMFRTHTSTCDDPNSGVLGAADRRGIVNASLEPQHRCIGTGQDCINDTGDFPAWTEYVDNVDSGGYGRQCIVCRSPKNGIRVRIYWYDLVSLAVKICRDIVSIFSTLTRTTDHRNSAQVEDILDLGIRFDGHTWSTAHS